MSFLSRNALFACAKIQKNAPSKSVKLYEKVAFPLRIRWFLEQGVHLLKEPCRGLGNILAW